MHAALNGSARGGSCCVQESIKGAAQQLPLPSRPHLEDACVQHVFLLFLSVFHYFYFYFSFIIIFFALYFLRGHEL